MKSQKNAEWCRSVEMVKHGIKISGNANVQQIRCLMEYIVYWIHAQMEDFGMIKQRHVNVQTRRYGIPEPVFLQESIVLMVVFGIVLYTHAHAQWELSPTSISVILFLIVQEVSTTTPWITSVNVLTHWFSRMEDVLSQIVLIISIGTGIAVWW